jgi:hypothetical protein
VEDLGGMIGRLIDNGRPDLERSDRILDKLGPVWRRVPDWSLARLIVNLVPAGPNASDAEIEVELDHLLDLDPR